MFFARILLHFRTYIKKKFQDTDTDTDADTLTCSISELHYIPMTHKSLFRPDKLVLMPHNKSTT
jgi:hypothetical protein